MERDTTPEFNSSYHYEDDSVQFDSSEPICMILNDEQAVNMDMDNLPDSNDQGINDLQHSNITNNLPVFEPELGTSRRDTYSVDDSPLVIKPISTPKRSILKGSKTVKTNRSRSRCRMVQFARLPNTDGRIKLSKSHFNSKSNFTITDDETVNKTDCSIDSKKNTQFDIEDLDDDLDGVQPLDSSVSSLINSPILDNSNFNKSSKRRSRGNKVMSLVNSIEKQRNNESPKLSIRASDLLSMNGSKHNNLSFDGSQNNASKLEESASSTRRINLENIFEAEDSLKYTTSNLGNETVMPGKESLEQASEINSHSVNQSVNFIGNVSSNNDTDNTLDQEYNFASPLNLQFQSNSLSGNDQSTCGDPSINDSISEVMGSQFDSKKSTRKSVKTPNMKNCSINTNNKHLGSSNTIDNSSSVSVKSPTLDPSNNGKTQNNCFIRSEQTTENVFTDDQKQDNESAVKEKNNLNTQTNCSKIMKEDHSQVSNDVSEYAVKMNNISELNDSTSYEDSPSMIVQCMSEMFNSSEIQSTCTPNESFLDTYVIVDKDDISKTSEKNKTNESLDNKNIEATDNSTKSFVDIIDSIKEQLDMLHSSFDASSNSNQRNIIADSMSNPKNNKTTTSEFVSEQIETTNLPVEVNKNISKHVMNSSLDNESTKSTSFLVTKNKSLDSSVSINYLSNNDHLHKTEFATKLPDTDVILNENNTKTSSSSVIIPNVLLNAGKEKEQNLNLQKMLNLENAPSIVANKVDDAALGNQSCSTKPTRKILKVINITMDSSSDDDVELENNDHVNKTCTNEENILDTSISKPQCESTPWTSSENSKTKSHSTSISQITDVPETVNRSYSPLPHPDIWSEMMKDFNESVKKANFSVCNAADVHTVSKVLFNSESNTCPTIQITTAEELFSNDVNMADNVKENNTIQCSLISCLPNNFTQTPDVHVIKLSTRNSNNSLKNTIVRKSPRVDAVQVKATEKAQINTPKSTIFDVIPSNENNTSLNDTKTNLAIRSKVEKSSSVLEVNINCATSNGLIVETSDSERCTTSDGRSYSSSSKSPQTSNKTKRVARTKRINSNPVIERNLRTQKNNESSKKQSSTRIITEKKLRSKLNSDKKSTVKDANELTSSIMSNKNIETNSTKSRLIENLINPTKTRITRSSTTLTELSLPKLIKINRTLSPVESKSIKAEKPKKIKSSKPNKKTQFKRLLPSNPIKTNSDTSEYESEDNTSEPLSSGIPSKTNRNKIKRGVKENLQLVGVRSTRNKEKKKDVEANCLLIDPPKKTKKNIKIKDVQSVNDSPVFTTKPSEREKIEELNPKVTSSLCTRSRKRPANTPVSQPNAKGPKRDTSSETASTAISLVTTCSSQIKTASSKKCTRNKSKLTVLQISDSSLPETSDNKKDKPVTRAKKRALSSEDSCDSVPSTRKVTRQQVNVKETEVKKATSTRASSRSKDRNLTEPTTSKSTKVRFEK